ncbi:hypothetical protein SDC9_66297 [bioreactor metagenome]|uniref:Uncharacterized protein n=1 Tax=bioreactor metagenome TaxID=1076179 RepID=A0A644XUI3_9ZZZZ
MSRVDVHEREGDGSRIKGFVGQVSHHDGIFSAGKQQRGTFELRRHFPEDVYRFGF